MEPCISLKSLKEKASQCKACQLCTKRTNVVFGVGNPNANIMLIGEAPGVDEDEKGVPFIGKSGALLTILLERAAINREAIYITNTVKCRPPNNMTPGNEEISTCKSLYLNDEIEIVKPKIIVLCGFTALKAFIPQAKNLGTFIGAVMSHEGLNYRTIAMYHPAYLLRCGTHTREYYETINILKKALTLSHSK